MSTFSINGQRREATIEPGASLLEVLRDGLGLTGAKYGCGEGQCGACTVLMDGQARRSCVTAAESAAGRQITTIEGLAPKGRLHPVQQAFLEDEALQCGYCTPGMIMAAVALLKTNPRPSDRDIASAMEGNVCRCGVYSRIASAIKKAAERMST